MRVQLTRKLAECLDGVDISTHLEGDIFELPDRQAELLIAEQWAIPVSTEKAHEVCQCSFVFPRAEAADIVRSRVQRLAQQLEEHQIESQPHRRIEDRVLDELRERRERIVKPPYHSGDSTEDVPQRSNNRRRGKVRVRGRNDRRQS
jgi:hypothetical protein